MALQYYNNIPIQSYNAIFNFITTQRNDGKTWSFKIRQIRRFIKKGKKCIWVRRFKNETKKTKRNFYNKKICKKLGLNVDDFELKGNTLFYKKDWFIEFVSLGTQKSFKSADSPEIDTIIFDEFTDTPARLKLYRGDEVTDFLDLFYSMKRCEKIKCFFLGNKEAAINPYFNYFNVTIKDNFEGFKTFRNNSLVVEQRNGAPVVEASEYENKVKDLLAGTPYGEYIYNGAVKNSNKAQYKQTPKNSLYFASFDLGLPITLYKDKNAIYAKIGVDKNKLIYSITPKTQYKNNYVLHSSEKQYFKAVIYAYKINALYYEDARAADAMAELLKLFSVI